MNNNDVYVFDGFYGPIPNEDNTVDLTLYAERYIDYHEYIKYIPIENMNYLNAVFTSNNYKVTNMNQMFSNCKHLLSLDVSNWDTSKVKYMDALFKNCESIIELDLNNWDTRNVLTMKYMFDSCYSLKTLKADTWDVYNVRTMEGMFYDCKSINRLRIWFNTINWKTYPICDKTSMYDGCNYKPLFSKFKSLLRLNKIKWDNAPYGDSENSILDTKEYKPVK